MITALKGVVIKKFLRGDIMAVEQVKAFFDKAKEDSALAQKLKDAQAAYTGDKSDKDAAIAAVVIPVAAEAGFNFTVADFKAAFDNSEVEEGEVSEDELNAVAGGEFYLCGQTAKGVTQLFCKIANVR